MKLFKTYKNDLESCIVFLTSISLLSYLDPINFLRILVGLWKI